jgi:hypothetical protein
MEETIWPRARNILKPTGGHELVAATGDSLVAATGDSLTEAVGAVFDRRSADEILGYDEHGLPR